MMLALVSLLEASVANIGRSKICGSEVMTFIAVSIGQIFHAVPDAAGGLPLDDYASILA